MPLPDHITELRAKFGHTAVLLPIPKGRKGPCFMDWQKLTLAETQDENHSLTYAPREGASVPRKFKYQDLLAGDCNIGVLQGTASGRICSIDIDDDSTIEPFLSANPAFRDTFQTRGSRGRNFWFRASGTGPLPSADYYAAGGDTKAIELRCDGRQTVAWGRHPTSGANYQVVNDGDVIDFDVVEINFLGLGKKESQIKEHPDHEENVVDSGRLRKRRAAAEEILGVVDWFGPHGGFCKCPGDGAHENSTSDYHSGVFVNGRKPTVWCYHKSCKEFVSDATDYLRSAVRGGEELMLPNTSWTHEDCADELFARIGDEDAMFWNGGRIAEILEDPKDGVGFKTIDEHAAVARFEKYAVFVKPAYDKQTKTWINVPTLSNPGICKVLLKTEAAQEKLKVVDVFHDCPVICPDGLIVESGYVEGVRAFITSRDALPSVAVAEAVAALTALFRDYQFATPGDSSRAVAGLLAPALLSGGIIEGRMPVFVIEADENGSGKTLMSGMVRDCYKAKAAGITESKNGVGSFDESIAKALASGNMFVFLDNLKDGVDSSLLEFLVTCDGAFDARVPGRYVKVNPAKHIFQLTGNGFRMTKDLSSRALITRIHKKRDHYFDWDPQKFIKENQPYYLGCIFSVIRAWVDAGKPVTRISDHRFAESCGVLDALVHGVMGLPPLLEGHTDAQARVSDHTYGMICALAGSVSSGEWLQASTILESADGAGVKIPGDLGGEMRTRHQNLGRHLSKFFDGCGENDGVSSVSLGLGSFVARCEVRATSDGGNSYKSRRYCFGAQGQVIPPVPDDAPLSETRVKF